jgi:hypothetical protein
MPPSPSSMRLRARSAAHLAPLTHSRATLKASSPSSRLPCTSARDASTRIATYALFQLRASLQYWPSECQQHHTVASAPDQLTHQASACAGVVGAARPHRPSLRLHKPRNPHNRGLAPGPPPPLAAQGCQPIRSLARVAGAAACPSGAWRRWRSKWRSVYGSTEGSEGGERASWWKGDCLDRLPLRSLWRSPSAASTTQGVVRM